MLNKHHCVVYNWLWPNQLMDHLLIERLFYWIPVQHAHNDHITVHETLTNACFFFFFKYGLKSVSYKCICFFIGPLFFRWWRWIFHRLHNIFRKIPASLFSFIITATFSRFHELAMTTPRCIRHDQCWFLIDKDEIKIFIY